jgi:chromosome segregation ATPase
MSDQEELEEYLTSPQYEVQKDLPIPDEPNPDDYPEVQIQPTHISSQDLDMKIIAIHDHLDHVLQEIKEDEHDAEEFRMMLNQKIEQIHRLIENADAIVRLEQRHHEQDEMITYLKAKVNIYEEGFKVLEQKLQKSQNLKKTWKGQTIDKLKTIRAQAERIENLNNKVMICEQMRDNSQQRLKKLIHDQLSERMENVEFITKLAMRWHEDVKEIIRLATQTKQ